MVYVELNRAPIPHPENCVHFFILFVCTDSGGWGTDAVVDRTTHAWVTATSDALAQL